MLFTLCLVAAALGAERNLDTGLARMEAFEYQKAVQLLEQARLEGPYELADHRALFEALGIARAALGQREESVAAFEMLLALDPAWVLPYTLAPKITFPFEQARDAADGQPRPSIQLHWPLGQSVDQAVPVAVEVVADPLEFFERARLYYRNVDRGEFDHRDLELPDAGGFEVVTLPGRINATAPGFWELYLVALDPAGSEVLSIGAATQPRRIDLGFQPPVPWYRRWWVWALGGAVVATAAGTTAYLLTREPDATVKGTVGGVN